MINSLKKLSFVAFYTITSIMVLYLLINLILEIYPNFYTVIPQKVYRSAEMSQEQYRHYINKYHIKTILNLEGRYPSERWYRNEIQASKDTNTQHINYRIDAKGHLPAAQLQQIAQLITTSRKPLLIHCWHGADRTGLGSVMALLLLTEQSLPTIKAQLSLKYGVVSSQSVGVLVVQQYQAWLKQQHFTTKPAIFKQWLAGLGQDKHGNH